MPTPGLEGPTAHASPRRQRQQATAPPLVLGHAELHFKVAHKETLKDGPGLSLRKDLQTFGNHLPV